MPDQFTSPLQRELQDLTAPFPLTEDRKNHKFDYETPRKVYVVPTLPGKQVFVDVFLNSSTFSKGGAMTESTMWDYAVDEKGDPLPGSDFGPGGEPGYRVLTTPHPQDPGREVKSRRPLKLWRDKLELQLPKDKIYLRQLMRCPQNANIDVVDGHPVMLRIRDFFIEDPLITKQRKQDRTLTLRRAKALSESIPDGQLEALAIYFGYIANIHPVENDQTGELEYDLTDLRWSLETFARDESFEFYSCIKHDPMFRHKLLVKLALHYGVILPAHPEGYNFYPKGMTKPVRLASSQQELLDKIGRGDLEAYAQDIMLNSGYLAYLEAEGQAVKPSVLESTPDDELRQLLEKTLEEKKALEAKLRAKAEAPAPAKKRGRPTKAEQAAKRTGATQTTPQ